MSDMTIWERLDKAEKEGKDKYTTGQSGSARRDAIFSRINRAQAGGTTYVQATPQGPNKIMGTVKLAAPVTYVSYEDYGRSLADRVSESEERLKTLYGYVERAPAVIDAHSSVEERLGAEGQAVYDSEAWKTNPLVFDLYWQIYTQKNTAREQRERAQQAYASLQGDIQKAEAENRAAVDAYNQFTSRSGAGWDEWRRGVRSEEAIKLDIDATNSEIERIKSTDDPEMIEKLAANKGALDNLLRTIQRTGSYMSDSADVGRIAAAYGVTPQKSGNIRQYIYDLESIYGNFRGSTEEQEAKLERLNEELDVSRYLKWEDLRGRPDFEEKSVYVSTSNGREKKIDYLTSNSNGNGVVYDETGYDDLTYEAINGNTEAAGILAAQKSGSYDLLFGEGNVLSYMTDSEKQLYNYIHATQGREVAEEYLDTLKHHGQNVFPAQLSGKELEKYNEILATEGRDNANEYARSLTGSMNERQRAADEQLWREYAAESPVEASVFSALTSPLKGISYLGQAADYMDDGKIDQNANYNRFSYENTAVRDEVAKKIEASGKWGKVGSFLYQTGMSMGDFLMAAAGGSETVSLAIMGTGAAADSVIEAKDRGLSDGQAFALGTIAGAAEILTEKVSLETLLKGTKWSKSAIGYFVANTLAEGSEEAASDVINWVADVLIAQDQSQWRQDIAAYVAQGMSENEAFIEALKDKAVEIGLDALGGAVSGGVMSAPGSIGMSVNANRAVKDVRYWNEDTVRGLIDEGMAYGRDAASYKLAQELERRINSGKEVSRRDVGYLITATNNARAELEEQRRQEREKDAGRQETDTDTPQTAGGAEQAQKNNAPESGTGEWLVPVSEDMRRSLSTGKNNFIARTASDIVSFVKSALQKKGGPERLYMGTVPNSTAELVKSSTGLDVTGYNAILPGSSVQHIFNHHGDERTEAQRGQRAVTAEDISLIPQVLASPDSVALSEDTDADGRRVLVFTKQIGDTVVTAQAVTDGRHALTTSSLWIQKKKGPLVTTPNARTSDPSLGFDVRNAPPSGPSDTNVSRSTANVNRQIDEAVPPAPMTIEERDAAVAERERALEERTREFQNALARGEDVSGLQEELMAEADDIEREKREIARAEQEEITRRQRAATTLPTGREIEERRERAGNLRELERSGRESGATEEQIGVARRIADATGRRIVFINEGENARRGSYTGGTIYVNAAYGNETGQIIAHELTHSIESSGSYDEFSQLVQRRIMDTGGDLDGMLREVRERYDAAGVTLDSKRGDDMKEVVAEYVERELLTSPESIASLVKEDRSLGRRILDALDSLLAKITKKEAAKERAFIRRARDLYANALRDTRSGVDSEAALQQLREAYAAGELTEEEFDRAYDALGIGVEAEGGGQNSVAAPADRREVAGRLRNMLSSGASVREIRQYVNTVAGSGTRQSPAGTRTDGARQIINTAHGQNMSVDEYLRQNWDEYEIDGELRPEARRALEMEGGRTQYAVSGKEIEAVQGIGRKSVNDFTAEDIENTEAFANRYFQELGEKSPFFRAWFGDWRVNDKTPIQVVNVDRDAPYKAGKTVNNDTGRVISWGSDFQRETRAHQRSGGIASSIVGNIESLVKNAVLLDTVTSERSSKTKLPGTSFMHSFYALAREADGNISLMKLYAEEAISAEGNPFTRAYELKDIEKVGVTANGVLSVKGGLTDATTSTKLSVADLFDAVKRYDTDFNPQPASKIVDEDGRPLVVYHGTDADFNVFDRSKGRSTMDIQGSFFSPWELDAEGYGGNVRAYYLNIKNPAPEGVAYRALNQFKGRNNAGILAREYLEARGYDGVDNSGEEFIAFRPEQIKLAEGNRGTFDKTNPDIRYSVAEGAQAEAEGQEVAERDVRETVPAKARGYLERVEGKLSGSISLALNVPKYSQADFLSETVQNISREYLQTGKVSDETVKSTFDSAYQKSEKVSWDFYRKYKNLGEALQKRYLKPTSQEIEEIGDYWAIKRSAYDTLHIVSKVEGVSINELYREFSGKYPEIFPADVAEPREQLVRLFEASRSVQTAERFVKDVEAGKYKQFKAWARNDFKVAVSDAVAELRNTKRYSDDRAAKDAAKDGKKPLTLEDVRELYPKARDARKAYEKVSARNLLTAEDQRQVGRLMRGDIELSDLKPERDNVKGITEVFKAKQEYEQYARQIREWNEARRASLRDEADGYLATANGWKDKKKGILYSRETMERNVRDIVPDQRLADRIVEKYFTPVHRAAAQSTKLKNRMRDRVRALELSRKAAAGNAVSEAHAVQLLGEARDNIDYLTKAKYVKERDGKSLSDWRGVVQELYETNPNMDWDKVDRAIEEFRKIYDELFELMNDSRVRNGYEPVAYRRGYFPHFQPGEGDGIIALFGKALGISTEVTALPTTINGLTHTFRPGIRYFGNALERTGFNTCYDAVEGFDKYIEGVADVIYQTENIQRLRALASQTRYRTSDEGLKRQVDDIRADASIPEQDRENRVKEIYEKGRFTLSNFVVELDEYTNLLANKKSRADRNMEQALGRNMYNLVKTLEGRVAANMVAINPGSWLTNFIPLTQGGAMLDRGMLLHGMWDTLRANFGKYNDDIVSSSVFLANRRGSDPLVRTWQQSASAKMSRPMELIDNFTADSLVRARYRQNVNNRHMSETAAMEEADSWVAGVMADRSKGSTPTLFQRSNPLTKMFTQFQLEVNNQLGYVFKDMPRGFKEKGMGALAWALFKFALGAWLYDEVYEYLIGRRPALDPLGMLNDTVGDLTGWELPNLVSLAGGVVTGDVPSFRTQKGGVVGGLLSNVADQLPFMGAVGALGLDDALGLDIDAGRLPMESAIPDVGKIGKAFSKDTNWAVKKRVQTAAKEIAKPLYYIMLPFGGGQMKKILEGVTAAVRGGSYTVDSEGRDIMQYPVYTDTLGEKLGAYVGGAVFGKSSGSNAVRWVESNFKNYSAKATGAYQGLTQAGVRGRDADELIIALVGAEKTGEKSQKDVRMELLRSSKIPEDVKIIPYYALMANDSEIELIDKLADRGVAAELLDMLMKYVEAGELEEGAADAKRKAVFDSKLNDDEKIIAIETLEPSTSYTAFKMRTAQKYKISMDDYYAGIYGAVDIDGDGKVTQPDKVEAIRRLNISTEKKAVLYQLADSSWKPNKNPFATGVGQEVYDIVEQERARRETEKGED